MTNFNVSSFQPKPLVCEADCTKVVTNSHLKAELFLKELEQKEVVSKGNTGAAYPNKPVTVKSWENIRQERRDNAGTKTVQDAVTIDRKEDGSNIYTVKAGDTMWDIAESCRDTGNFKGRSVMEIITLIKDHNEIKDASKIRVGQKIEIPTEGNVHNGDNQVIKNKGTSGDDVQIDTVNGDNNKLKQKGYEGDDYQEANINGDNNVTKQKGHEGDDTQVANINGDNNVTKQKGHTGDDTQIANVKGDNNLTKQKGGEGDDIQLVDIAGDNNKTVVKGNSGDDLQSVNILGNDNKVKANTGKGNDVITNTITGDNNKETIKLGRGEDIVDVKIDENSNNNRIKIKGDMSSKAGNDMYNVELGGEGNTVDVNTRGGYERKDTFNLTFDTNKYGNFNLIRDEYNPEMYVLTTEKGENTVNIGSSIKNLFINGRQFLLR